MADAFKVEELQRTSTNDIIGAEPQFIDDRVIVTSLNPQASKNGDCGVFERDDDGKLRCTRNSELGGCCLVLSQEDESWVGGYCPENSLGLWE